MVYKTFVKISRYLRNNLQICQKIAFFEVKCHFTPFPTRLKINFLRMSKLRRFNYREYKLMKSDEIHSKYLELTFITYENIQKVNRNIFLTPQYSIKEAASPRARWASQWKFMKILTKMGKDLIF